MASSKEHYEQVLAPVYAWMLGGFPAALERNAAFFRRHGIAAPRGSGRAVDLGAGCGFQSIPLAELGYTVTAIDLDAGLLRELEDNAGGLPISCIEDDLVGFMRHVEEGAELIVCMTDTLLHLESRDDVRRVLTDARSALEPGGRLVLTFRELTHERSGLDRFIPVRSDEHRILTCFLEFETDSVKVHDLLYREQDGEWRFDKSYYRKLRLPASWVTAQLDEVGFEDVRAESHQGLVTIVAGRGQ